MCLRLLRSLSIVVLTGNALIFIFQGRFQFYVVVYDFYNPENVPPGRFAVDRFPLDISLGQEVPASIERKTYYGVYNIAKFDFSFELTCSDGGSFPCGSGE